MSFSIPKQLSVNIDASGGNVVRNMPSVLGHQVNQYTFTKIDNSINIITVTHNGSVVKILTTQGESVIVVKSGFNWVEA